MEEKDPRAPIGWADDKLSEFLEVAQQSTFATFANLRVFFGHLIAIDRLFRQASEHFGRPHDWLAGVFLLRAHSAFLGAVRLGTSGQLPEAYTVLRSCLEAALYALHIEKEPSRAQIWIGREESEENRQKSRAEFTARRVFKSLADTDAPMHEAVSHLYERSIDHGAHPNEQAFLTNMSITETEEGFRVELRTLSGHTTAFELCLKSILQVTLACLSVFQLIAPQKFALLGISDELQRMKRGM